MGHAWHLVSLSSGHWHRDDTGGAGVQPRHNCQIRVKGKMAQSLLLLCRAALGARLMRPGQVGPAEGAVRAVSFPFSISGHRSQAPLGVKGFRQALCPELGTGWQVHSCQFILRVPFTSWGLSVMATGPLPELCGLVTTAGGLPPPRQPARSLQVWPFCSVPWETATTGGSRGHQCGRI